MLVRPKEPLLAFWTFTEAGCKLIRALERWAKSQGIKRIELRVFSNNDAAIRLYDQLGFALEGRQVKAVEVDGSYIDLIQMAKLI
jgi:RimJ/RimL family protein N-acetyltransferase